VTQEGSPDDLLTIPEAAELLKVSTVTISRWRRQGKLQAFKVGPRAVRIRRGDLLEIFAPYRGAEATLEARSETTLTENAGGHAGGIDVHPIVAADASPSASDPAAAGITGAPAARSPGVPRREVINEVAALRATMLTRRGGMRLPTVLDDGRRVREKRRKRR
jgi:excisionase family DNA binding protein